MPQENDLQSLSKRIDVLESKFAILIQDILKLTSDHPSVDDTKNQKPMSAKEFLLTKKTKNIVQKTLVLGYFLEVKLKNTCFNVSDLENIFRLAKEPLPKNLNDMVNKNVAKGLIMEASELKDTKKAWFLTATGEKLVEENFSNE